MYVDGKQLDLISKSNFWLQFTILITAKLLSPETQGVRDYPNSKNLGEKKRKKSKILARVQLFTKTHFSQ